VPKYDYACDANRTVIEVVHDVGVTLRTWGEVCYVVGLEPGNTDPGAPVRRVLTGAPAFTVPPSDRDLRDAGFTKLVKRDDGVYENVTATGDEDRFMRRGQRGTRPHLHKKVRD